MTNQYSKMSLLIIAILLGLPAENIFGQPLIREISYFKEHSTSLLIPSKVGSQQYTHSNRFNARLSFTAYGHNKDGSVEGMAGNIWDYFTIRQTTLGQSFITAADNNHLRRGHLWVTQGKAQGAINEANYVLMRIPNHPRALIFSEMIEKLYDKPNFALNYYQRALNTFPQYALTHAQYGKYLCKRGKTKEGIKSLKQALALNPKLAVAHGWLSQVYSKSGNKKLAKESKEMAIKLGFKGKFTSN